MKRSDPRKNREISDRAKKINYSAIRKSFTATHKRGLINATLGQPDFDVPFDVKNRAKQHIDIGHNKYTETRGILPLRQAVSKNLAHRKINRSADEIVITSGTTSALFMTMFALVDPGDKVIILEPYFVAYPEIVKMVGGDPVIVKTSKNFQPDINSLQKAITKRTKLIILNSPNNPTGAVYSENLIKETVKIARKTGAYILSDEIYNSFVYEVPHYSAAEVYEKTIIVDGLSKSKGMTGWRIGFVAGPKHVVETVEKIQQFTSVCAAAPFQHAAISAFSKQMPKKILKQYSRRRDILFEGIKHDYDVVKPEGAFYIFLKTPIPASAFIELLLQHGLSVVPGKVFGRYENFVRISYSVSDEEILKIVAILKKVSKKIRHM